MPSHGVVVVVAALWLTVGRCGVSEAPGPGPGCDNGKLFLEQDLPDEAVYGDCSESTWINDNIQKRSSIDTLHPPEPVREECMNHTVSYSHSVPSSGVYRPVAAQSGEYLFCPPQRWLNNLHHGATVLLHHPCLPAQERHLLSVLARSCLSHYIITAHPQLRVDMPVALVSWGRILQLSAVFSPGVCDWLESTTTSKNQLRGGNGVRNYNLLLTRSNEQPHNIQESVGQCCERLVSSLKSSERNQGRGRPIRAALRELQRRHSSSAVVNGTDGENPRHSSTGVVNGTDGENPRHSSTAVVNGTDGENPGHSSTAGVNGTDGENPRPSSTAVVNGTDGENPRPSSTGLVNGTDGENPGHSSSAVVNGTYGENPRHSSTAVVNGTDGENPRPSSTGVVNGTDGENPRPSSTGVVNGTDGENPGQTERSKEKHWHKHSRERELQRKKAKMAASSHHKPQDKHSVSKSSASASLAAPAGPATVQGLQGLPVRPRSEEAVWAAAALSFLLVLLTLSVLHTRLYRHWKTTPSLYWTNPQQQYDSVADVIRRRLRLAKMRRKRGRRKEVVLLPISSSEEELP